MTNVSLSECTMDELVAELRNRGVCYSLFSEADVLAQIENRSEFKDMTQDDLRTLAEDMFDSNIELIQDAMARGGNDAIDDLVLSISIEEKG